MDNRRAAATGEVHEVARAVTGLTTLDLWRLEQACRPLNLAHGWATYIVGSAMENKEHPADIDVRTILDDDLFDRLFPTVEVWQVACVGMAAWLHLQTGLPIDFQYQRMTEANARDGTTRNPVGNGHRVFAGGGDATTFDGQPTKEDT